MTGRTLPLILLIGAAIALASCNSTDALIPQVDVGVTTQSTPLTQRDLDAASNNADQYASRQHNRQPAPQEMSSYQPSASDYPPQNTLEAQAQAMQSGQRSRLSTRLYQQQPQTSEPQQNQMLPAPIEQQAEPAPVEQPPEQTVAVARGEAGTIRFLPIIGAPLTAVTPLSKELGSAARTNGLTILPSSDRAADNILKGYLSAFDDGGNVNIVYVWDILDSAGNRLHRLQGQQSTPKQGSDPWASVSPELMQTVAKSTIGSYIQWKNDHGN